MKDFSKGLLVLGLSIAVGIGALNAGAMAQHDQHKGHSGMKMSDTEGEITLQGEVLDLYCFMKHPTTDRAPTMPSARRTALARAFR
jgi:hypothetical protein